MPTIVWVSAVIGTSFGILAVAVADSFPSVRPQLTNWGGTMLCASAALFGFALALV